MNNLLSLLLGLAAWVLPFVGANRFIKEKRGSFLFSLLSLVCCAASLLFQVFSLYYGVVIQDWSALMDTSRAILIACCVMTGGTLLANILPVLMYLEAEKDLKK